jgi:hypothetical protein
MEPSPTRRRFLNSTMSAAAALLTADPTAGQKPSSLVASPAQFRQGPFVFRSDFPWQQGREFIEELVQLQDELVRILGIPPADEPVEIRVFNGRAAYQAHLAKHYPHVPYRSALFVKPRGPGQVLVYRHGDFETDLRHECTHALLHAVLPEVPLWLDEGLAEYFEVPAAQRPFDNPHLGPLRWNLRLGTFVPLPRLETIRDVAAMGLVEYRFAWAWVHFMLHGPVEAHRSLVAYLADLRVGRPTGSLAESLTREVARLDQRFVEHFKQNRPRTPG